MISLKQAAITLLLGAAIALSAWSILLSKQSTPLLANVDNNRPDAFMEEVIATIINDEGKPTLKITAPKMVHYIANDATLMTKPSITVFRKDSATPWFINSNYAEATQGINQIIFEDHVVIHHPADKNNPTTIMRTNSLTIFPQKQLAETKEAVTISQPASVIRAVGMLANLNEGTVKLLSQTREEYVPNS